MADTFSGWVIDPVTGQRVDLATLQVVSTPVADGRKVTAVTEDGRVLAEKLSDPTEAHEARMEAARVEREAERVAAGLPANPLEVPVVARPPIPQHRAITIVLGQTQIVLDAAVPAGFESTTQVFLAGTKLRYRGDIPPTLATEYTVAGNTVTFGLAPVAGSFVEIHAWRAP